MIDFTSSLKNGKHVLQYTCYVHNCISVGSLQLATPSPFSVAHQHVQSGDQTAEEVK